MERPLATLTDLLTSKIPPHSLEAERAVLGCLLSEAPGLARALTLLEPADFYKEGHRLIFTAMATVAVHGDTVDTLTVSEVLRNEDQLTDVGGAAYLVLLTEEATSLRQLETYARIIAEKARLRDLIRVSTELIGQAYESGGVADEIILSGLGYLEAIQRRGAPPANVFPAMLGADLLRLPLEPPTFHVLGWVPRRSITLVFGDSEAYKSWFTLLMALCVAAGRALLGMFPVVQAPTLVVSEENGIDEDKRRLGALARGMGLDSLEGVPIHMVSESGFSFDDPVKYAALQAYVAQHGIQLVVFDSFVRVHRRKENDAGDMNLLYVEKIKPLIKSGLSLVLLHHRRKVQTGPGQAPVGDSDEIRGSGDIRAATHSALSLRTVSDTQVLVKHNKTRGFRRQEPYVFAVQDDDGGGTVLTWEGKPEDALDKSGACREAILLFAAEKGSFNRKDLQAALKGKFSRRVFDPILKALAEKGTPLRLELRGGRKTAWYVYVPQLDAAPHSAEDPEQDLPF